MRDVSPRLNGGQRAFLGPFISRTLACSCHRCLACLRSASPLPIPSPTHPHISTPTARAGQDKGSNEGREGAKGGVGGTCGRQPPGIGSASSDYIGGCQQRFLRSSWVAVAQTLSCPRQHRLSRPPDIHSNAKALVLEATQPRSPTLASISTLAGGDAKATVLRKSLPWRNGSAHGPVLCLLRRPLVAVGRRFWRVPPRCFVLCDRP